MEVKPNSFLLESGGAGAGVLPSPTNRRNCRQLRDLQLQQPSGVAGLCILRLPGLHHHRHKPINVCLRVRQRQGCAVCRSVLVRGIATLVQKAKLRLEAEPLPSQERAVVVHKFQAGVIWAESRRSLPAHSNHSFLPWGTD